MKKHCDSILTDIIKDVYQSKSLTEAKAITLEKLEKSKIEKLDKNKMIEEINKITSLTKFQTYMTNAMFRFEGLSVNSYATKQ